MVKENLQYFQAEEDSEHWREYLDYLDDVVLDGLFECVQCSLLYLKENTDKKREMPPLMMAKLELQVLSNNFELECDFAQLQVAPAK